MRKKVKKKQKHIHVNLMGKRYRIERHKYLGTTLEGDCSQPTEPNKAIRILMGLRGKDEMRVYIHEMLHACLWVLDETTIEQISTDIANALWKLKYRKQGPSK